MPGKAKSKKRGKSQNEKMKRESVTPTADPADVNPFEETESLDNNKIFIECPGATVYDPQTREIIAGVVFVDENDPSKGYRVVNHLVFAPGHKKRRLINKKHRRRIRRCQACQDLTVRLIRREGPDFFIPNPRFPRKRQLKPVEKTW